jgi:hypothetical protein
VDFETFHLKEIPRLLAEGRGGPAGRDLGPGRSLALCVPGGGSFTYRSTGDDLSVVPGDDAPTVVELAEDAFADLVSESRSVFGLLYGDRVSTRCLWRPTWG